MVTPRSRSAARRFCLALLVPALAAGLAACQTSGTSGGPLHTGSVAPAGSVTASDLNDRQALGAVQTWGAAYRRNEKDKAAALNYSAALRAAGQTGQAVEVMRKSAIHHAGDRDVLAAFGKALADAGQFEEALRTIQRAQRRDNPDWRLLSAEGAVLDAMEKHVEARAAYAQALVLAPGEAQTLNNLGMSYLLTGELEQAETTLRRAVARPGAPARARQNLAVVLVLKGRFEEAEAVASQDLSAAEAKANIAWLKATLSQRNDWADLRKSG